MNQVRPADSHFRQDPRTYPGLGTKSASIIKMSWVVTMRNARLRIEFICMQGIDDNNYMR